tara:strand:+ start:562 stop:2748 length:2187 start_codon:yes stop_codon:yes gene_type:complete
MALLDFKILPGIDKQNTTKGAENRWIDSNNIRFRYGLPEKVGGWASLINDSIVGVVRNQHAFVDTDGNKYIALGTDKFLLLYFEGQVYDISPFDSTRQQTSATIATANASAVITITTGSAHGAEVGDIILLDSVTLPSGTSLSASNFEDKKFMINTVPSTTTFTITSSANAGATVSTGGSTTVEFYYKVGPQIQTYGYGWGVSTWGGTISSAATTDLDGALSDNTSGTGGSGTSLVLTSATGFPTSGTVLVGNTELITYTGKSSNTLTGITRGALGSTRSAHNDATAAINASDFTTWGNAIAADQVELEPGKWSLDNFGQVLVATANNGKTFTWNPGATSPLTVRSSLATSGFETSNNPTASRLTLISPTTRHLIHLGTETTIGTASTQDDMFIRFSGQEDINTFTPTSTNTAGTLRIQDGTKIMGALKTKEAILIWTDNALYSMKFVGAPFIFGIEQVGTNCGLVGSTAAIEVDGIAYWMSAKGFLLYDGTVKTLPCSVEDEVYDNIDTTKGQQITAGLNNLFSEITWWYPTNSDFNNKAVTYNYAESAQVPGGIWALSTEPRTSWIDANVYNKPYATKFDTTGTGTFPVILGESGLGQTKYFEHEIGTDQTNEDGSVTTILSYIQSYDFDMQGQGGEGDFFLSVSRFIPDFKTLVGTADVTLALKRYPSESDTNSTFSPFTISASTDKIDTRARGRYVNFKIENTEVSQSWRYGTFLLDVKPDGAR